MKSTGITRNIDEVGRIVIPREIRKSLKLSQGTPMEIFVQQEELVLKRISPIFDLKEKAKEMAKLFYNIFGLSAFFCDLDVIVAGVGENKKDYIDKPLSRDLINLLNNRTTKYITKSDEIHIVENEALYHNFAIAPIIIDSNCYGAIILINSQRLLYNENTLLKISEFISECIKL